MATRTISVGTRGDVLGNGPDSGVALVAALRDALAAVDADSDVIASSTAPALVTATGAAIDDLEANILAGTFVVRLDTAVVSSLTLLRKALDAVYDAFKASNTLTP